MTNKQVSDALFAVAGDQLKIDPTCHCGTSLSQHSVYDNHPFTEMETFESMDAKLKHAHRAIHILRAALHPLAGGQISIEDVNRAAIAMMETQGFPFTNETLPLVLESTPKPRGCACAHDDEYECFRLRYGGVPEFGIDDDMPRECCECACHDDYEDACNQEAANA